MKIDHDAMVLLCTSLAYPEECCVKYNPIDMAHAYLDMRMQDKALIAALEAENSQLRAKLAAIDAMEPVGYVMQADDGSIGNRIAPTGWVTFKFEWVKLNDEPRVKSGTAVVAPLYALKKEEP